MLFQADIANAAKTISDNIHVDLNQNQYDAILDLVFNAGLHKSIRNAINGCHDAALFAEMRKVIYSNGVKLPGLVQRREYEIALFQKAGP